jgi:hypothetical protein
MVLIYASEDLPPSHPIVNIPFPQNAKGFFYYHSDPTSQNYARLCVLGSAIAHSGSRRARACSTRTAWMGCTLPQLIKHRRRRGFLSVLREENLVSEDLVNDVHKLDISSTVNFEHSEHLHVLPLGTLHSGIKAGPWSYNRPLQVFIHIEPRASPSP